MDNEKGILAFGCCSCDGYLGGSSDQGIIGKRVATLTAIGTKGKVLLWTLIVGLLGTAGVLGVNLIL